MKPILISIILYISIQIYGQPYPASSSTGQIIDDQLIRDYLHRPFKDSSISFYNLTNFDSFFRKATYYNIQLISKIEPLQNPYLILGSEHFYMEAFIGSIPGKSISARKSLKIKVIEYSDNVILNPIIRIGMTPKELKAMLGPWNYEFCGSLVYYFGKYAIECNLGSEDKIKNVLVYPINGYLNFYD